MPPKAEKKPTTAGKAPAGKAPAAKKEAGKKTAPATGEKKKRSKTRKETYSSYIYKGMFPL
jgi:histone H2B